MVFFVDSGGNVLNTTPENVYQGSANANEIVLVGQFPANSVVEVAYKTPNGIWTEPQVITASQTASNGFTVWKTRLSGVVTERFGKVSLQFYIYGGTEEYDDGEELTDGALLATAETSFNVGKGIPRTLPDNFPTELGYKDFVLAVQGEMTTASAKLQTILEDKVQEVNSSLDSKISKFESVGVGYYLYTYYQGETKPLEATNATLMGSPSVILRDFYGRAQVYEPAADFDITNKIYVDRLVSERFSSHGGTIQGNVTIEGDLQVKGSTVTLETETLKVSDNYVVVNTDAVKGITSGIVIRTAHNIYWNAYGIVYNPLTDSVDIGEGEYLDDGSFYFDSSQMQSIATRAQNIPDGAILRWDAQKNTLVNSGKTYTNLQNAYEFAQEGGFEGTVNEFRQMLARVSNNALYLDDYDGFVSVTGTPTEGLNYDNINDEYYSCSGLSGTVENRENIIIANEEFGLPVREIATHAFSGEDIKTVNIPDSVLWIDENAFDGCVLLERVILGDGIDTIKEYAFNNCNLKTVNIPNSTTEIWENAFSGNEFLRSVMIGANVKEIGENAFSGCTSLIQIGFGGTVAQWLSVEKGSDWNLAVPATYVVCKNGTVKIKEA